MMNFKVVLVLLPLLLFLGSAGAVYELCDSIERDSNAGFFRCNINSSKIRFMQEDIDSFWKNMEQDGSYANNGISTVEWKIKNAVIEVADDLRFIEPEGMNLAWDLVLSADVNTVHDINEAAAIQTIRPGNLTAIKKKLGSMQEYLISFAPAAGRKGIRNMTVEKPAGALDVYILGSHIKKMELDLEGQLSITGGHLENLGSLKAKDINLSSRGYISKADSIEAENILLETESYIRNVGRFGETAIRLDGTTGLSLKGKSYIDGIIGGIEAGADISLENESRIENVNYAASDTIQWIKASNLTMSEKSVIRGLGGSPGQVTLSGSLSLSDSFIAGKQENKPRALTAKSISLSNNAYLAGFSESINVTGKETFELESGAAIKDFAGTINSCASLSMDGNTVAILFASSGAKTIKAKEIVLDNNATIGCVGNAACEYTFVQQNCSLQPSAVLNAKGTIVGNAPFTVEFVGVCDGKGTPVTCIIRFGDGNNALPFDGNAVHTYEAAGKFNAVLTAANADGLEAKSKKVITVLQPGEQGSAGEVQASVSKQSIKAGEEISLSVDCNGGFDSFLVENDFGLAQITTPPAGCPATLGPFTVPGNATAGTHSFTLSGVTAGGEPFSKTVSFAVEGPGFMIAGISFDLSGLMGYALAGLALVVVLIVVLVLLVKKKRKEAGYSAKEAKPFAAQEAAEEKKPSVAAPAAAAKGFGENPPWLRLETEEETFEEAAEEKPAEEKEEGQAAEEPLAAEREEKPAEEIAPEKLSSLEETMQPKPVVPEAIGLAAGEKQAEEELFLTKEKQAVEKPVGAAAKKPGPSAEFRDLVEKLKESAGKPVPVEEEKGAAATPEEGQKESGEIDWAALEQELFVAQPKKKPAEENKAGGAEAAFEGKPAGGQLPSKKAEEKKPLTKRIPFFSLKRPVSVEPKPAAKKLGPEAAQEKGGLFLKKKKEEKKEEEKQAEVPSWLRKKQ